MPSRVPSDNSVHSKVIATGWSRSSGRGMGGRGLHTSGKWQAKLPGPMQPYAARNHAGFFFFSFFWGGKREVEGYKMDRRAFATRWSPARVLNGLGGESCHQMFPPTSQYIPYGQGRRDYPTRSRYLPSLYLDEASVMAGAGGCHLHFHRPPAVWVISLT